MSLLQLKRTWPVGRLVPKAALFLAEAGEKSTARAARVEGSLPLRMSCVDAAISGTGLVERGVISDKLNFIYTIYREREVTFTDFCPSTQAEEG